MADVPVRPPPAAPPLPPGWTEHKAPTGHAYYYNKETGKSTYIRPVPDAHTVHDNSTAPAPPQQHPLGANYFNAQPRPQNFQYENPKQWTHQQREGYQGGHRGNHNNFTDRRRQPEDRPKHRHDIPNCAPWVLVKTKLGRRFVWNKDTDESFWKFPLDVMKGVVEFDRREREKRERKERGEQSEEEDNTIAEVEAELAAAEEEIEEQIVEVDGDEGMEDEFEYEEVEITDEEEGAAGQPSKRQRTEEPIDQPLEMDENDMAWQLAQIEAMEAKYEEEGGYEDEEEGLPLTEEDCKALFKELLDDANVSPYTPWDKILEDGVLFDDERYKALPNMKARKECFDEWARYKIQFLKEQKAKQQKLDPKIPYLAFLHTYATPKLYWPEFRRKYKKEPEMKNSKLAEKDMEKLYRDHIKRLGMTPSDMKSDLSTLLKAQPIATLNQSTTLETLPSSVLTDLRFITLPGPTRNSLVETYISTLPPAPEGAAASAEEEAAIAKKREERQRREKALAERERRVRDEKKKQERDLAYSKGRLREEEEELQRAMQVGKDGLRGHFQE